MALGMTDQELESLCEKCHSGVAPWAYWTSEIYSFGKCIRYWAHYPTSLPLYVYSDHGVPLESHFAKHELENPAHIHFTWNTIKALRNRHVNGKRVFHIPHPWIKYRRKLGIERISNPRGTLVFFMHGTPAVKWKGHDSEEYFEALRSLPEEYQPVVLCLHMHDINAGLHKKLREYGFPIVTVGNTSCTEFVDRFYNLVRNYAYVTSQDWGSYVAYCVELGIPFFLMGNKPVLINFSDENIPFGETPEFVDNCHKEMKKRFEVLFQNRINYVTQEQYLFVNNLLGLKSDISRNRVKVLLWAELYRNWREWPLILKHVLFFYLSKTFLYNKAKLVKNIIKLGAVNKSE